MTQDIKTGFDPFTGPLILLTAPTTESQREVWTSAEMGTAATLAFNESISLRFKGALDLDILQSALHQVVRRHESLRMTFSADGTQFFVSDCPSFEMPLVDLSAIESPERTNRVSAVLEREVRKKFDLIHGPLFRAQVLRLADYEHLLVLTTHHIVCDGWSYGVLLHDLGAIYAALKADQPMALEGKASFSKFAIDSARALTSPGHQASESYWVEQFREGVPALELPTDRIRPPIKTYTSAREDYVLSGSLIQAVRKTGAKSKASLVHTMMTAFNILLFRLSGQEDQVVGLPAAGQAASGQKNLVGHCVNTLPIRNRIRGEESFLETLTQLRASMLNAFEHQQFTFGSLLKRLKISRDASRLPLVSVLFNVDQTLNANKLGFSGLDVEFFSNPRQFENFELFVNCVENSGKMVLEVQYNSDLFDGSTIRRWMSHFESILAAISQNPHLKISLIPLLSSEETKQILLDWNATASAYPRDLTLSQIIERQVEFTPSAIAAVFGQVSLTYGELDERANRLARHLRKQGVLPGTLVGIALDRSLDMLVAVLGVLKAGGAYVPLDPAYPKDRIAYMVEHSALKFLVTQAQYVGSISAPGIQTILIDQEPEYLTSESPLPIPQLASPQDPAYVIYTSGSTGKPKGVVIPHRAVVNFLTSMAKSPGLGPFDRVVAVTTLSFDIAVLELYLPLVVGARTVIASREVALDSALLAALVRDSGATAMQATPGTWRLLLEGGWEGSTAAHTDFKVLIGGEALPRDLLQLLLDRVDTVWNMYGPTETTVWSTCLPIKSSQGQILIGRPIANTQIYLLDQALQPVPIGVSGEIYIGGAGVTLGYLNRPDLTSERFIENPFFNPFAEDLAPRLYKTGDLARFLPNGNIEYIGRNDQQVKVRGFRIELGEIESVLSRHPSVSQSVVMVCEATPGDLRVVAYMIPREGERLDSEKIHAHLRASLPEYMIPQHFMTLGEFPRTQNGKIDRKSLPSPIPTEAASDTFIAPRTPVETVISSLWQNALGLKQVGVQDDFFKLGGHSLLATRVMSRIKTEYEIDVSLRHLFEAPTVERLAILVESKRTPVGQHAPAETPTQAHNPILPRQIKGPAPLSLMQQRLWYIEQLNPGSSVYNLPASFKLCGKFDLNLFRKSFAELLERHEALRTVLREQNGVPLQVVLDTLVLPFDLIDLSDIPATDREAELEVIQSRLARRPFNLNEGALVRAEIIRLCAHEHVLFFMPHHAVFDGWSFDLFLRDLTAIYSARECGLAHTLPVLPIQYADFSIWHRKKVESETLVREMGYWKSQLGGELPVLELPCDRPRPPLMSFSGGTHPLFFKKEVADQLTGLARSEGATLYMALLTAFKILLFRHSGQNDVVIGSPIQGRAQPETEDLVGFFVNTLALRTRLDPAQSFRDALRKVRETCLGAFGHQDMPFEKLVEELKPPRDLSRTPIFQAFFSFQDTTNRGHEMGSLAMTQLHLHSGVTPTDISFWVKETGNGLSGAIDYRSDLFDSATIARFMIELETLLGAAIRSPDSDISSLEIVSESERQTLLQDWNSTTRDFPINIKLHELFVTQAERTPDATAVICGEERITFGALLARTNSVAAYLNSQGIGPGDLVGLAVDRSIDMVGAMLGILRSGAAYVPLDPAYPTARIAHMISHSRMKLLLAQRHLVTELPTGLARSVALEEIPHAATFADAPRCSSEDPAYVIYTSGSTGTPKGVSVPHRAAVNLISSMAREPGLKRSDRLLAITTLSFDISVLEIFLPLVTGAQIILATREEAADGTALLQLIRTHQVSVVQATPATWRMLLEAGLDRPMLGYALKGLCGGEPMPPELAARLLNLCDSLWNMYGPTETTVWSTCFQVKDAQAPILIGRPIANTQTYVLDAQRRPLPIGVPGELYIGGAGVTLGYLHQPELTMERFMANPFTGKGLIYRTGDLARWREDGNLECLGRNDHQIKIRGFRIELAEIETALAQHPSLRDSVVAVREFKPGDPRLVAYVVPQEEGGMLSLSELRQYLRGRLPDYMLPQHLMSLSALPLTSNGKIDRKRLPDPFHEARSQKETSILPTVPRSASEIQLSSLWRQLLGTSLIGVHDNFFDLGGHSLLAMQLVAEIEKTFGVRLSPRQVLLNTLEQMATLLPSDPQSPVVSGSAGQALATPPPRRLTTQTPFYFGSPQRKLFGVYEEPKGGPTQNKAILLCYPIAQEYMRSHWAFRKLSTVLARQGFSVLRFDYRGTGDSTDADPAQAGIWVDDIVEAASELKNRTGVGKLSLIGLRMGAYLAARASSLQMGWEDLILWDPVVRGADYLSALKRMHLELLERSPKRLSPAHPEQFLGFSFPTSLQEDIQAFDLRGAIAESSAQQIMTFTSENATQYELLLGLTQFKHVPDAGQWENSREFDQALLPNAILTEIATAIRAK